MTKKVSRSTQFDPPILPVKDDPLSCFEFDPLPNLPEPTILPPLTNCHGCL